MVDKRSALTVSILVGGIVAVLYPIAVIPLLGKGRKEPDNNNNGQEPGFRKSSHWGEVQRRN